MVVLFPVKKLQKECHSRAEPAPVMMGAGVQFKDVWIPACAGMTDRHHVTELNNILKDTCGIWQ